MHPNDLGMINLHRAGNNSWSYTAYKNDFAVWITNRDMADPGQCIDEIAREILVSNTPQKRQAYANPKPVKLPKGGRRKPRRQR